MRRTGFWNRGQGSAVGGQEDSFQFSEEWFPSAVSGQQSAVSNQRSERMAVGGQQSAVSSQRSAISSQQSERMAVSKRSERMAAIRRSAVSGQQSAVSNQQSAIRKNGSRRSVSGQFLKRSKEWQIGRDRSYKERSAVMGVSFFYPFLFFY